MGNVCAGSRDGTLPQLHTFDEAFAAFDKSKDGTISMVEFITAVNQNTSLKMVFGVNAAATFRGMDADGDARVSKSEFIAFSLRNLFTTIDKNHDDKITMDELIFGFVHNPAAADFFSGEFQKNQGASNIHAFFDAMDKDGDYQVTFPEFVKCYVKLNKAHWHGKEEKALQENMAKVADNVAAQKKWKAEWKAKKEAMAAKIVQDDATKQRSRQ